MPVKFANGVAGKTDNPVAAISHMEWSTTGGIVARRWAGIQYNRLYYDDGLNDNA